MMLHIHLILKDKTSEIKFHNAEFSKNSSLRKIDERESSSVVRVALAFDTGSVRSGDPYNPHVSTYHLITYTN